MNYVEMLLSAKRDSNTLNDISVDAEQLVEVIKKCVMSSDDTKREMMQFIRHYNDEILENILIVLARREALNKVIDMQMKQIRCK